MTACDLEIKLWPVREMRRQCLSANKQYSNDCQKSMLRFSLIDLKIKITVVAILFSETKAHFTVIFTADGIQDGTFFKNVFSILIEIYIKNHDSYFFNVKAILKIGIIHNASVFIKKGYVVKYLQTQM